MSFNFGMPLTVPEKPTQKTDIPDATSSIKIKMPGSTSFVPVSPYQIHRVYKDDPGDALFIIIDEVAELLMPSGVKTEAGKQEDQLKQEIAGLIQSITQLGRSGGIFMFLCTQRNDARILSGTIQSNCQNRAVCGNVNVTASLMALGNANASTIPAHPEGRGIVSVNNQQTNIQYYFQDIDHEDWLGKWYADRGLDVNGYDPELQELKKQELSGEEEFSLDNKSKTFEFDEERVNVLESQEQHFEDL